MDKVALIADVHGNIIALEAVLADIERRGITTIYNLGDLIGKGSHSAEVIDICRERCDVIIRGNWDAGVLPDSQYKVLKWDVDRMGAERVAFLQALPNSYDFLVSGKRVRIYHASHISEHHRIRNFQSYDTYLEMFSNTEFTGMDKPEPDIVGYADIHNAFINTLNRAQKIVFNTGSVGNPLDMPLASYTILSGTLGSEQTAPFALETVRVQYDIEKAIQIATEREMPFLDDYAYELRTAIYRRRKYRD